MIERQEIHCHACGRYVRFDLDMSLNGNHVLNCPSCGHEHCRVVRNGIITGDRWASRNGPTWTVTTNTAITVNMGSVTANTASLFLHQAWLSTTGTR